MPINQNGTVTSGTRANLIAGLRSEPMTAGAVDAVLGQAAEFTQSLVDSYEANVAAGEVGEHGSCVASDDPIIGQRAPTALLYGRVQSGKTAAMVLTAALALDNGFRIVIVLTSDILELVRQTANRFKDLDGPRVLSTLKEDETSEWRAPDWQGAEDGFLEEVAEDGLVFVCAKNALHLPEVLEFLQGIDAAAYPSIIFDDEADAATPDTTVQARSSGRANAPAFASTIHRRIVANTRPGEEGQSARELLPHSMYVQVTASPFVLILQRTDSRIHPTVKFLLEPGPGYCGGERFFGAFDPESNSLPAPPLVLVADRENSSLVRRLVPQGLASSIEFALVATAALINSGHPWPISGFKHLSHTSPINDQHRLVAQHIERHLRTLRREVRHDAAAALARFAGAHVELRRSLPNVPALADLMPNVAAATRQAQVLVINSKTQRPQYGPRVNFLVGGNILGRGLTIKELLVTYYLRQAQVSQMDTVLQHARMYGYRDALMAYTRVYLPHQLATLFRDIHQTEQSLRLIITQQRNNEDLPVRIARGSRATRPGTLETGSLRVYSGDLEQVATRTLIEDENIASEIREILVTENVPLNEPDRTLRARQIPLERVRSLVELLEPSEDDFGRWSVEAVLGLLTEFEDRYAGSAVVYVRRFETEPSRERTRARLSGPEVAIIREASPELPALVLLHWQRPGEPELWFPTLVLPENMPTYIFGPS